MELAPFGHDGVRQAGALEHLSAVGTHLLSERVKRLEENTPRSKAKKSNSGNTGISTASAQTSASAGTWV